MEEMESLMPECRQGKCIHFLSAVLAVFLVGCTLSTLLPAPTAVAPTATPTQLPAATATSLSTSTSTPTAPPTSTPKPTATLALDVVTCPKPPDTYERVEINGETLTQRTVWMLQHAQELYGGPGDLLRVTQGSYTPGGTYSFGTHDGGGAVDISIRNPANPSEILWDETDAMVQALRRAGFAAWYRAPGDLGEGSAAHIHALAIGDRDLSTAARQQIDGAGGYFDSMDGLPAPLGPNPDRHGGPAICDWMLDLEYNLKP